jgi:hypothetical protein
VLEHGLDIAYVDASLFKLAGNRRLQSLSGQLGQRLILSSLGLALSVCLVGLATSKKILDTVFMNGVVGGRVAALDVSQRAARIVGVRAAQGRLQLECLTAAESSTRIERRGWLLSVEFSDTATKRCACIPLPLSLVGVDCTDWTSSVTLAGGDESVYMLGGVNVTGGVARSPAEIAAAVPPAAIVLRNVSMSSSYR